MIRLVLIIIFFGLFSVYGQSKNEAKLNQYAKEVEVYSKLSEFEKALESAEKYLAVNIKMFGIKSQQTAASYSLIGDVNKQRREFQGAAKSYKSAIEIYEYLVSFDRESILKEYKNLILVNSLGLNREEREANYSKAILSLDKRAADNTNKEILSFTLAIARLFLENSLYEVADEYFLKCFAILPKAYEKADVRAESRKLSIVRTCSLADGNYKQSRDTSEIFRKKADELAGIETFKNIVNGTAVLLPKPKFPSSMRGFSKDKIVPIDVTIDELGNVKKANAICGFGPFESSAERAAMEAKFSPTFLDGKPVNVTGIITYNFVR